MAKPRISHVNASPPAGNSEVGHEQDGYRSKASKGFIAIYRWEVEPEHEQTFRERWGRTTMAGRNLGAFGSCLARDREGRFVAVALWPSQAARAAAFEAMGPQDPWIGARRVEEIKIEVEDNLWAASPFPP